jgi:hypothetical protein
MNRSGLKVPALIAFVAGLLAAVAAAFVARLDG